MRQSFTWWSFCDRGVEDLALLTAARDIGFDGVEFLPEPMWAAARQLGLALVAIKGHESIPIGLNDPAHHASIAETVRRNLDQAKGNEIGSLIVFSGNRRPGISEEEARWITADGLAKLAPLAEAAGVNLLLELLNSKRNHVGYQADHTAFGAGVCRAVNSGRVKLLYDIYHMQIMEGDLIETIGANADLIGHYHTGGCPGRAEPDESQEIHYPAIVAAIAATGYNGFIGHEFLPRGEVLAGLRAAYKMVDSAAKIAATPAGAGGII